VLDTILSSKIENPIMLALKYGPPVMTVISTWLSQWLAEARVDKFTITATGTGFATAKPFIGEWHVHGSQLTIKPDLTAASTSNIGQCFDSPPVYDPSAYNPLCSQITQIKFTLTTASTITGKVTKVTFATWDNSPLPPGFKPTYPGLTVGDTIKVKVVSNSALYSKELGNPNLCRADVNPPTVDCGA
jgi:hypothetical protein